MTTASLAVLQPDRRLRAAGLLAALLGACSMPPSTDPVASTAPPPTSGAPGFLELRRQAGEARERGDLEGAIGLLTRAHHLGPQNPVVSLQLAELLAASSDREGALRQLQGLANGGVSMDLAAAEGLGVLGEDPRFIELSRVMEANRAPVARAEIVCELDTPGLMPEGIDFDPVGRRVILGSFARGQLVTADLDCTTKELNPPGTLGVVAGIRVDPARRLVWATSNRAEEGPEVPPAVVAVSLETGEIAARKEYASSDSPVLLNDIALTPDGTVYVTESMHGTLLRTCLECPGLEVFLRSARVPLPNGLTVADDGTTLYVAHAAGISRVDLTTGAEERLAVPPEEISVGADGLYWHDGSLLAVQNQPFHDRIVRFALAADGRAIRATRILNARFPGAMFHSTGFVLDGRLYFNGVPEDLPPPPEARDGRPLLLAVPLAD